MINDEKSGRHGQGVPADSGDLHLHAQRRRRRRHRRHHRSLRPQRRFAPGLRRHQRRRHPRRGGEGEYTAVIPSGSISTTVTVTPNFDQTPDQQDETLTATVEDDPSTTPSYTPATSDAEKTADMTIAEAPALADVTASDNSGNSVNVPDATAADLYVAEGPDGTASVQLHANFTEPNAEAASHVLYSVSGDAATPTDGNFTGETVADQNSGPGISLAPNGSNHDYTITVGVDKNGDGILDEGEITRTVKVHLCVELDWNTDDNGPALAGELIPLDGGAATPLDDARVTGQTGDANLVVDWGDGSPTDDGSLIHFFDNGTYTIAVSYGGASLASVDATVIHSTNSFDPHDQPSNPEDLDQLTTSNVQIDDSDATPSIANSNSEAAVTSDASASAPLDALAPALASPLLGAPQPAPDAQGTPPVIIKENIPLTPGEEASIIAQEEVKGKALAAASNAVYVGVCEMTTDTAPRTTVVVGGVAITTVPCTDKQLYIPVSNATTESGSSISAGGYDLAAKVVNTYAQIAKCTVTDDGSGNLKTTLPGGVELDLQKEGGYGVLQVKRPEGTTNVLFADVYRSIVAQRADGSDITDIDRLDGPAYDTLVEEKNAEGLLKVPPPKLPQAIRDWVDGKITGQGGRYIEITTDAVSLSKNRSKGAPYVGPSELPSLAYIRGLHHLRFELSAGSLKVPGFASAVAAAKSNLQASHPGWVVDVVYK